jgi:hypothetical protein
LENWRSEWWLGMVARNWVANWVDALKLTLLKLPLLPAMCPRYASFVAFVTHERVWIIRRLSAKLAHQRLCDL